MRAKYPGAPLADLYDPAGNPGSGSSITEVQVLRTRDRLGPMDMQAGQAVDEFGVLVTEIGRLDM